LALTECLAERIARYVSVGGSARACGVGVCPRLVPTLGGPGEASRPRTGGIHRLDHPRTPGASRPRGREDPSWVAAMACLWVDVLSKTKPGDTGPRRPQDSHWRDHGLGSSHTANPQNTVFTPKFSPYRSLWTTNEPNGPQISVVDVPVLIVRCPAKMRRPSTFFWTYLIESLWHKRGSCSHFHLLTARVVLPRRT